jgi:hypothetical protein
MLRSALYALSAGSHSAKPNIPLLQSSCWCLLLPALQPAVAPHTQQLLYLVLHVLLLSLVLQMLLLHLLLQVLLLSLLRQLSLHAAAYAAAVELRCPVHALLQLLCLILQVLLLLSLLRQLCLHAAAASAAV